MDAESGAAVLGMTTRDHGVVGGGAMWWGMGMGMGSGVWGLGRVWVCIGRYWPVLAGIGPD